ncbi:hypothetical protein FWH30_03015 [Microgenomates group bacterium]|nr:hypothetical protein [Microgenomates group bacterium]
MKKVLVIGLLILAGSWSGARKVRADDCEQVCTAIVDRGERETCVNSKVVCLENKIRDTQNTGESLKREISILDSRVALTEAQIEKTKLDQVKTQLEMEILADRAANLSVQLEEIDEALTEKIGEAYKSARTSPLTMFLRENGLANFITAQKQEKAIQDSVAKIMWKKMTDKISYENQVDEKEEKQEELKQQEQTLARQQTLLASQKQERNQILSQTKNDEQTYQRLLSQARAEIDSYARFAQSQGGGTCLGASPGGGEGGWFYSQRDPRWCRQLIGRSNDTIGSVGCLLTSVAMIFSANGQSTSPATIAANNSWFSLSTAYMVNPPPVPSGFTFRQYGYYAGNVIDEELGAGRPVIVGIRTTSNSVGTHFVVLKSGSGGSYRMNDPWHGADLDFSGYYGVGQIYTTRIFTK